MTRLGIFSRLILALVACVGVSGCLPSSPSAAHEQKEPHVLAGKARATSLDYKGAAEAFEKALEVNPRNASAHFELALLYERDDNDPSAAVYHFERYLRLRPNAENANIVKDRLLHCKQGVARGVSPGWPTPNMPRDLARVTAENRAMERAIGDWAA